MATTELDVWPSLDMMEEDPDLPDLIADDDEALDLGNTVGWLSWYTHYNIGPHFTTGMPSAAVYVDDILNFDRDSPLRFGVSALAAPVPKPPDLADRLSRPRSVDFAEAHPGYNLHQG